MLRLTVSALIILVKLKLTLLMIVMAHVHEVFSLTKILWLTLTVVLPLTALYEQSAGQNCSLLVLSHSSTTP